jgi:hypothetical protein
VSRQFGLWVPPDPCKANQTAGGPVLYFYVCPRVFPLGALLFYTGVCMSTIIAGILFVLGFITGVVVMWRWGGVLRRQRSTQVPVITTAMLEGAEEATSERIALRKDRIMEAATALGKITNNGVEDLFCIGDRTASSYLSQLVAEGRLTRHGAGRGVYYVPVGPKKVM